MPASTGCLRLRLVTVQHDNRHGLATSLQAHTWQNTWHHSCMRLHAHGLAPALLHALGLYHCTNTCTSAPLHAPQVPCSSPEDVIQAIKSKGTALDPAVPVQVFMDHTLITNGEPAYNALTVSISIAAV